jgi:DNA helicase-2/ATP-dependent DNA helicase PcrA
MEFTPRPSQRDILTYTAGKMGISAVPGSGKTHTLSALAAQIIRSGVLGLEQEVLIVTLVNSAVDNFENRIQDFLNLPIPLGYRVRTLHGLAHDIVREKPAAVGLEERFTIIDEREAGFIRKEAAQAWLQVHPSALDDYLDPNLDDNRRDWMRRQKLPELIHEVALAFIRTAKDHRLTPEHLRALLDRQPAPLPLAEMGWAIYADYQRALIYRGAVDFDDLIRLALDLLDRDSEYLERLRYRWPYILEDEAQDSSELQEQILHLLAGPEGNWVRVGDPNQAIFETFTTASPQHLIKFIHEEADDDQELPVSGRSQPSIIALANQLIQWVNNEHPEEQVRNALTVPLIKPTSPDDPQPNPPDDPSGLKLIGRKYSPEGEIEAVVKSLEKWLPKHLDATVAVLVPRNTRGAEVIKALKKRKIDCIEFLSSSSSTRLAAGRLSDAVSYLADPQSASKLAKAYLAWRQDKAEEEDEAQALHQAVAELFRKCRQVETFLAPTPDRDWLSVIENEMRSRGSPRPASQEGQTSPLQMQESAPFTEEALTELANFRQILRRWQGTTTLPIDQMVLTLAQDLFTAANDLALTHKLAILLRQTGNNHPDWRLPELNSELGAIARNERRFLGFSEEDSGFDPERHKGKVVVTTMHKAKGLEWDRVYLMSVNNYDFPSNQSNDRYISEKWFVRDSLNLEAEVLAQLKAAMSSSEYDWYTEGKATLEARLDYVRERLRLLYVGITRAKRKLVITWNSGRFEGEKAATQSLPFAALQGWWEANQDRDKKN